MSVPSHFEISIGNLTKYIKYLDSVIKLSVEDCIEREDIFKLLNYSRRLLSVIQTTSEGANVLSTDIYTFLRKVSIELANHSNNNIFLKDKTFKELKSCCKRNYLYLEEKYSEILSSARNPEFETVKVNVDLSFFLDTPNSVEDTFTSLTKHENDIYYFENDDNFQFLYFFRGEDENWYWSPPKKEDKEDLWIKVPNLKIPKGYFANQKLSKRLEEFIHWLDIFSPDSPEKYEFYEIHNKRKGKDTSTVETVKLVKKMDKIDEKVEKGECLIF